VETDHCRTWVSAGKWAQPRESSGGVVLGETTDRSSHLRSHALRLHGEGVLERRQRRDRAADALKRDSVEEIFLGAPSHRRPAQLLQLLRGGKLDDRRRCRRGGVEERTPRGHVGVKEILSAKSRRTVGVTLLGLSPLCARAGVIARCVERQAEMQPDESGIRMACCEGAEPVHRPVRPASDSGADLRLDRSRIAPNETVEHSPGVLPPTPVIGRFGRAQSPPLRVVADDDAELQRWRTSFHRC